MSMRHMCRIDYKTVLRKCQMKVWKVVYGNCSVQNWVNSNLLSMKSWLAIVKIIFSATFYLIFKRNMPVYRVGLFSVNYLRILSTYPYLLSTKISIFLKSIIRQYLQEKWKVNFNNVKVWSICLELIKSFQSHFCVLLSLCLPIESVLVWIKLKSFIQADKTLNDDNRYIKFSFYDLIFKRQWLRTFLLNEKWKWKTNIFNFHL